MLFKERVVAKTCQPFGRSGYRQTKDQTRHQTNDSGQRENTDSLKLRIGGRSRSIPVIQRFNQGIRKREGDQAYEDHDLKNFARHE